MYNNYNKYTGVRIPHLLAKSSATCCEISRCDWQNSKMATKNVLQKFLRLSFSKTQVFHIHRSIDRQEWEHKQYPSHTKCMGE